MKSFIRKSNLNFSGFIIKKILSNKTIQKKHLLVYLLEYINDFGAREFLLVSFRTLQTAGLKSILNPRKILLYKIKNKGAGNLLAHASVPAAPDFDALSKTLDNFFYRPKISFILPVYNTNPALLKAAIESIRNQLYDNWQLCIADDCSPDPRIRKLLNGYSFDTRINTVFLAVNSGISDASNAAINISTGDYIALVDHDDEITRDALYWIVKELNDEGETDILYSDECKIDEQGKLSDYFFKPDWSPELLFNMMYTGHLTVYRRDFLLKEVGLFRKAYDFSQDYDLMLRAAEKTTRITHLRKVLYYWRITKGSASQGDKPYARKSNIAALEDAMQRRGIPADVGALPTANRVKLIIDQIPGVSVVIPTDSFNNLKDSLESIYSNTVYPVYEIVVVINSGLIRGNEKSFS